MTARLIIGAALHELRTLPDSSVDLVVTSSPFLAVRDYLPADHPLKQYELGQGGTPLDFVADCLEIADECARVLTPHGSLCWELGDSMADSGGAGGDYYNDDGQRAGQPKPAGAAKAAREAKATPGTNGRVDESGRRPGAAMNRRSSPRYRAGTERWDNRPGTLRASDTATYTIHDKGGDGWPLPRSHALVPELMRLAMAYGQLPFSDLECEQWVVRNVLRWCKPNPSVGAEGDKFRRATTDIVCATQSTDRYWDPIGARGPSRDGSSTRAPLYDWWDLPTGNYRGAHFATFPLTLAAPLIASMCPHRVCTTCGQPARRITTTSADYLERRPPGDMFATLTGENERGTARNGAVGRITGGEYDDLGWTWCGHDGAASVVQVVSRSEWKAAGKPAWPGVFIGGRHVGWRGPDSVITPGDPSSGRRGVVLDPFAGSGTTIAAAEGAGRDSIGIELLDDHASLAVDRVGPMFLTIEPGVTPMPVP